MKKSNTTPRTSAFTKVSALLLARIEELSKQPSNARSLWFLNCYKVAQDQFITRPVNYITKRPYTGLNAMVLPAGQYLTFNQGLSIGAKLKKGSKSLPILIATPYTLIAIQYTDEDGTLQKLEIHKHELKDYENEPGFENLGEVKHFSYKGASVFKVEDFDELKPIPFAKDDPNVRSVSLALADPNAPDNASCFIANQYLQAYLKREGIEEFEGNNSFYNPSEDTITITSLEKLGNSKLSFYEHRFHECMHSTGHQKRLNRQSLTSSTASFGSAVYNEEEIVAELGATHALIDMGLLSYAQLDTCVNYILGYYKSETFQQAIKEKPDLLATIFMNAIKAYNYFLKGKNTKGE